MLWIAILLILERLGIKSSYRKEKVGRTRCESLGFVFNAGYQIVSKSKILQLLRWSYPVSASELHSILGIMTHIRTAWGHFYAIISAIL